MTSYKKCVLCKKFSEDVPVATITWTTPCYYSTPKRLFWQFSFVDKVPVWSFAPDIPLRRNIEVGICETCLDTLFNLKNQNA